MKIRSGFDWGHVSWPIVKGCDELCNNTVTFTLPFVGWLTFYSTKKKYSDGLWTTSGANGTILHVYSYPPSEDFMVSAEFDVESFEAVDKYLGDDHPKVWTDREVRDQDALYFRFGWDGTFNEERLDEDVAFALLERPCGGRIYNCMGG